jgi:hypothetical protein
MTAQLGKGFKIEAYRRMLRIRLFENEFIARPDRTGVGHSSVGMEASVIGACMALRDDDYADQRAGGRLRLRLLLDRVQRGRLRPPLRVPDRRRGFERRLPSSSWRSLSCWPRRPWRRRTARGAPRRTLPADEAAEYF